MESSNGQPKSQTSQQACRQAHILPPIGSLRHASNSQVVGTEAVQKPMEGMSLHQRCSSEGFLFEQPLWLDDLLNEPETVIHKGHRRSSSDSFAYLGSVAKLFSTNEENNQKDSIVEPSWGSQNLVHHVDPWHASFDKMPNSSDKQPNRVSESPISNGHSLARDGTIPQTSIPLSAPTESEGLSSAATEKIDQEDSGFQIQEGSTERINSPQTKPSLTKAEAKRAKQQSAHRSRVRKLQYIAELESNVQVLQAEGSEVSAALEFLDQQNLILGMENRALRQRLDSLSQEHLIKHLEQDMLEREIVRLQTLYQLQLQQKNRQNKSRDLDAQFANLSLKK
ncbi:uncharacterized protein At4g06598-like [Actinidia eriantha]|uniref:uncharacterized protein At4g06598-like n=1 Tax=Actinidia eriantha TaxID=165200 RepID=UPI002590CCAE|nr:uncharacterized protein At4g06598-like [Actinidia eriantha]